MAYLTKDSTGLIQLWNNKPMYNKEAGWFYAWLPGKVGIHNEIAVDVTNNDYFRDLFITETAPSCAEITLRVKFIY